MTIAISIVGALAIGFVFATTLVAVHGFTKQVEIGLGVFTSILGLLALGLLIGSFVGILISATIFTVCVLEAFSLVALFVWSVFVHMGIEAKFESDFVAIALVLTCFVFEIALFILGFAQ